MTSVTVTALFLLCANHVTTSPLPQSYRYFDSPISSLPEATYGPSTFVSEYPASMSNPSYFSDGNYKANPVYETVFPVVPRKSDKDPGTLSFFHLPMSLSQVPLTSMFPLAIGNFPPSFTLVLPHNNKIHFRTGYFVNYYNMRGEWISIYPSGPGLNATTFYVRQQGVKDWENIQVAGYHESYPPKNWSRRQPGGNYPGEYPEPNGNDDDEYSGQSPKRRPGGYYPDNFPGKTPKRQPSENYPDENPGQTPRGPNGTDSEVFIPEDNPKDDAEIFGLDRDDTEETNPDHDPKSDAEEYNPDLENLDPKVYPDDHDSKVYPDDHDSKVYPDDRDPDAEEYRPLMAVAPKLKARTTTWF